MLRKILIAALLLGFMSSCVPTKRLTYLQSNQPKQQFQFNRENYKVQPNDIISINIRTYDLETSQMFNLTNVTQQNALQAGEILFYLQGYTVDLQGNIDIPIVGQLQVRNLTVTEINTLVENKLSEFFTDQAVYVNVQLSGIRFSIVGEVSRPGQFTLYQNQVNIFEALAQAGDITIVGDRKEVMLIRQNEQGAETIILDLTDAEVLNNPNYFIQPNDVINVKPLPQKSFGIGTTGFQSASQIISIVASLATLIIAVNSLNN